MFIIQLTATFDDFGQALAALRDCEEVVGKNDGEVDDTEIRVEVES